MTPGGPSPLKHGRRFTSTTLVECRLSLGTAGRFLLQHVCVADNRRLFSDVESAASFAARIDGVGEQPGRERPHRWTPDPDPRVGSGVAHVPAACLRSRDDLRMPMPRTIDSRSDRKCTRQYGAGCVAIVAVDRAPQ